MVGWCIPGGLLTLLVRGTDSTGSPQRDGVPGIVGGGSCITPCSQVSRTPLSREQHFQQRAMAVRKNTPGDRTYRTKRHWGDTWQTTAMGGYMANEGKGGIHGKRLHSQGDAPWAAMRARARSTFCCVFVRPLLSVAVGVPLAPFLRMVLALPFSCLPVRHAALDQCLAWESNGKSKWKSNRPQHFVRTHPLIQPLPPGRSNMLCF